MTTPIPLDQIHNIKHPYADLSLFEVIELAKAYLTLNNEPEPATLEDIRAVITDMTKTVMHTWLTGSVSLDLLDAAIDGKDLTTDARYR